MGFMGTSSAATAGGAGAAGASGGGTLLAAAPLISAVGGAASAFGNAAAQRATLQYQQKVAEGNAILADYQAIDALSQGARAEVDLRKAAAQLKGKQRAALAANGVALNEGSPAAVIAATDTMRDADIATLRNNAARAAWGYRMQGANSTSRAGALGSAAGAVNPLLSGASSLLGSASGVAGRWYDLYKSGAFGTSAPDELPTGSSVTSSTSLFGDD